jgi:hypothetical protein
MRPRSCLVSLAGRQGPRVTPLRGGDVLRPDLPLTIRLHIAHHEAGHALMGVLLGRKLETVSLSEGHTKFSSPRLEDLLSSTADLNSEEKAFLLDEAKIALSGHLAEIVALGVAHPGGPEFDLLAANRILGRIGLRKGTGAGLQGEIVHVLASHVEALKRIAASLLAENEISQARVVTLLGGSGGNTD